MRRGPVKDTGWHTLKNSARSRADWASCVRETWESSECWDGWGQGIGPKPVNLGLITGTPEAGSSTRNAVVGPLRLTFCRCTCLARHISSWRPRMLSPSCTHQTTPNSLITLARLQGSRQTLGRVCVLI